MCGVGKGDTAVDSLLCPVDSLLCFEDEGNSLLSLCNKNHPRLGHWKQLPLILVTVGHMSSLGGAYSGPLAPGVAGPPSVGLVTLWQGGVGWLPRRWDLREAREHVIV